MTADLLSRLHRAPPKMSIRAPLGQNAEQVPATPGASPRSFLKISGLEPPAQRDKGYI